MNSLLLLKIYISMLCHCLFTFKIIRGGRQLTGDNLENKQNKTRPKEM
jgi:hypothetical protein